MTTLATAAATAALVVLAGLTVLQLALAAGAPIGRLAWGGAQRVLPTRLRVGSVVAVALYAVFAAFLVSGADLLDVVTHTGVLRVGLWTMAGYLLLNTLANAASRSRTERAVMTPASALLAAAFVLTALEV